MDIQLSAHSPQLAITQFRMKNICTCQKVYQPKQENINYNRATKKGRERRKIIQEEKQSNEALTLIYKMYISINSYIYISSDRKD